MEATAFEISIVTSDQKPKPRGARSSACVVAFFFAVVVDFGWPIMVIIPYSLSVIGSLLGGPEERDRESLVLSYAAGAASLGLVWITMGHASKRSSTCAMLQVAAVAALWASLLFYAMASRSPGFTAITATPFMVASGIKLTTARKLMVGSTRTDFQFTLRDLFWFILSLSALLVPVAEAVRAPAAKTFDPNGAIVFLAAYGLNGDVVEKTRLSYYDHLSGRSALTESDNYRAERGVARIVTMIVDSHGELRREYEDFYGGHGEFLRTERRKPGKGEPGKEPGTGDKSN